MRMFFLLLIVLLAVACRKTTNGSVRPVSPPPASDSTVDYLALGDSYTIGQSVGVAERFPAQTVALLRQSGVKISDPLYIAQTGWTTASLQNAIALQNPPSTFDVVSLLIGVNDQFQRMDTAGYAMRFTQLLDRAVSFAGGRKGRVFVLSIPDYSVTPFVTPSDKERVQREVEIFNSINRRLTLNSGISYTDITPSSREAATDPTLLANDGLHPSGKEYRKWAALLTPKVKTAVE